ncbi:very short patch repair endonuclease [Geodermatophilus sp. URMC 61]|uniref:very short patch repair endonuclease n=1 Tax=Geodermatophilus sp. URMC 61 TaxID=3423411 RepID=UPI00406CCB6D
MGERAPAPPSRRPWASSEHARKVMVGNRGRDTLPELRLRRAVHALGLRYRVCARPLPELRRTADLLFPRQHVAVFVDGCHWHGCPDHWAPPRTNVAYWVAKVDRNRARDKETDRLLAAAAWVSVRVWEHEDPQTAALRVRDVVKQRGTTAQSS